MEALHYWWPSWQPLGPCSWPLWFQETISTSWTIANRQKQRLWLPMRTNSQRMIDFELAVSVNFPESVKRCCIPLKKTKRTDFLPADMAPSTISEMMKSALASLTTQEVPSWCSVAAPKMRQDMQRSALSLLHRGEQERELRSNRPQPWGNHPQKVLPLLKRQKVQSAIG